MPRPNYGARVRVNLPDSPYHGKEGRVRLLGPGSYDHDVKVRFSDPQEDVWLPAECLIVLEENV